MAGLRDFNLLEFSYHLLLGDPRFLLKRQGDDTLFNAVQH